MYSGRKSITYRPYGSYIFERKSIYGLYGLYNFELCELHAGCGATPGAVAASQQHSKSGKVFGASRTGTKYSFDNPALGFKEESVSLSCVSTCVSVLRRLQMYGRLPTAQLHGCREFSVECDILNQKALTQSPRLVSYRGPS